MNEQMGLHQTKELLHSESNSHCTQESLQNRRKPLPTIYLMRDYCPESTGNSKNSNPKDQIPNEEMKA
jgi:hypothetical protein